MTRKGTTKVKKEERQTSENMDGNHGSYFIKLGVIYYVAINNNNMTKIASSLARINV